MLRVLQKELDNLWLICLLESHLSTRVNLCFARVVSLFLCSLFMYVCKFLISPLCVAIGGCLLSRVWCGVGNVNANGGGFYVFGGPIICEVISNDSEYNIIQTHSNVL